MSRLSCVPWRTALPLWRRLGAHYSACSRPTILLSPDQKPPIAYHFLNAPIPYDIGLQLQEDIVNARTKWRSRRKAAENSETLQDGEGDVVLLLGRRDIALTVADTHPEQAKILHSGAEFHQTKRGGQVTYHGLGQLVGYPILDLGPNGMSHILATYARAVVSESRIQGTSHVEILAPHPGGHVGVFAGPEEKLASIGIQIRHRLTSHGFAINVTTEPIPWFDLVTACGLNDVHATSLQGVLTGRRKQDRDEKATEPVLAVDRVATDLMPFFGAKFNRRMVSLQQIVASQEAVTSDGARDIWFQVWSLIRGAETEARSRVASSELPRRPEQVM
ncbi:hypothetical protein QFC22_002920 [Naganishia vaughanmartiniae]|uniref:Uncharacterized protein n=1 Tax=Naganishia vaughanmartiniae TaxID=1424756 RepID=A0ACC2X7N0_9TREE|nr:hypothetical protein QFC22_002920 [Naganishia vaughanmartiniae]